MMSLLSNFAFSFKLRRYNAGTITGHPNAYSLDDHHRPEKNKPFLVCGNTAVRPGRNIFNTKGRGREEVYVYAF